MGTSLAIIDATYGQLAPDADEQEAALPDTVDAAGRASRFSGSGQQTYTRGRFALGA
jgi:hypothetical protein